MAVRNIVDPSVVVGTLSSPLWYQSLEKGIGLYVLIGGAILLTFRVVLSWREWKNKK